MSIEDIKVIGVDEVRTHKPVPENSLYNVYYELSIVPTNDWIKIFEKNKISNKKLENSWIDGRHIVVKCPISEIDQILRELRKEVTRTNFEYAKNY
ncbi:MAG: hypothetical protein P8Y18_02430 [Candidatus Bathyarchaeota archaeon]